MMYDVKAMCYIYEFMFSHLCVFMCCMKPVLCSASFVCYEGISIPAWSFSFIIVSRDRNGCFSQKEDNM